MGDDGDDTTLTLISIIEHQGPDQCSSKFRRRGKTAPNHIFLSRKAYNLFYCGPDAQDALWPHRPVSLWRISEEAAQTGKCSVYNQRKLNFFHARFSNQTILLNSDANLHKSHLLLQAERLFLYFFPAGLLVVKSCVPAVGTLWGRGQRWS